MNNNYDDSNFRRDWESRYASSGGRYDDYEPGYRYGSYIASNERWRGKQWNDIEPDIRNEWEASHPKGTWERFKDSIRYGWESMTGQRDRQTETYGGTGSYGSSGNYDDSRYRSHWQSTYGSSGGSYDDYEPGYRYGSYLSRNDRYRGRQWSDIEYDVRNDWEASHPKGTWERFKDSIRYGWEGMTTGQRDSSTRQTSGPGYSNYGRDDSMFRRDWESRYASSGGRYDDYEPAYRYGSYLAGSDRYRGRQWNDIEYDVRNDWEASHPKGTWERFKDSIRYGWESMTGQGDRYSRTSEFGRSDMGRTDMGRPMQSSSTAMRGGAHIPDDVDRRSEFQHSYWSSGGRSDDFAPAYRYGADFADNDTNPNHQWSDVEARMRGDWEAYNRDPGSWDRNVDAIRYGWERGKQHARGTHSGHSLS